MTERTLSDVPVTVASLDLKGDVTRDDLQRQFLAQHSVAMLDQCCNYSKQCRNNVARLCCAKNRRCESSRLTSPQSLVATDKRRERLRIHYMLKDVQERNVWSQGGPFRSVPSYF